MVQGSPRLRQAVVQHLQGLWQSVEAPNLALERAWPDAAPSAQGCSHFRPQLGHLVCRRHSLVWAMQPDSQAIDAPDCICKIWGCLVLFWPNLAT